MTTLWSGRFDAPPDPAAGIDYRSGHYHRALADGDVRGYDRTRMDRLGETAAAVQNQQGEPAAEAALANGDHYCMTF